MANLETIFSKCSDKYAPLKTFRVRNSKQNFITPDIRQLMYRRDHLHSKAIKYSNQSLQNRSARAITRSFDWKTSVSGLLNNLKIMNLSQRYNYFISTLMYKCLNGKSPSYLANLFKSVSSGHNRDTGQSSNNSLYLPKPNVESFRRSLKYAGANLWNNLPQTVRNFSSLELFKATYKNQILFNSH